MIDFIMGLTDAREGDLPKSDMDIEYYKGYESFAEEYEKEQIQDAITCQ